MKTAMRRNIPLLQRREALRKATGRGAKTLAYTEAKVHDAPDAKCRNAAIPEADTYKLQSMADGWQGVASVGAGHVPYDYMVR